MYAGGGVRVECLEVEEEQMKEGEKELGDEEEEVVMEEKGTRQRKKKIKDLE